MNSVIQWKVGEIVARPDMALVIDHANGDEYLVELILWNDETSDYESCFSGVLAAVSGAELETFRTGVNPCAVDGLLRVVSESR
jgi:hypothetical protein